VVIRGKPDGWIGHSEPDHRDARRLFPTIAMSRCSGAPKRMTVSLSCCAFVVMGMISFAQTGSGQKHATKTCKHGYETDEFKTCVLVCFRARDGCVCPPRDPRARSEDWNGIRAADRCAFLFLNFVFSWSCLGFRSGSFCFVSCRFGAVLVSFRSVSFRFVSL
jgi:hypothetical protein